MTAYDLRGKRVWVAGHRGMVGAALVRRLARSGCEILTAGRDQVDVGHVLGLANAVRPVL